MQSAVIIVAINKTPGKLLTGLLVSPREVNNFDSYCKSQKDHVSYFEAGRRTQVVKGEVCKTSMQRFESARRLQISLSLDPPMNALRARRSAFDLELSLWR